ncbi:LysR family transcriptional regulator [Salibacterium aidingense]|uniref:LysR family transcriptional regulator n=1 Tax=Salibacterium aidingense TaxID=384933 RepID=UPI003BD207B4
MNLEDLQIFKETANIQNITKTAIRLNRTQSNITARIKHLEHYYNTRLFNRHRHGVTLTASGKTLLAYVEKVLQWMNDAENTLLHSKEPSGMLSLGSMETTAATRLPALLSSYHEDYPQVDLSLTTGTTERLIGAVLGREIEGAFVAGNPGHPSLESVEVFKEELVVIGKKSLLPQLNKAQLQHQTMIVFQSGCFYRQTFETWLQSKGVRPSRTMELNTLDGILGCVKSGLGISLLTKAAAAGLIKNKEVNQFDLPPDYSPMTTFFIYHKENVSTSAFKEFLSRLRTS